MNSIWGAELNYAPDYWPLWLIYAGVVIVLMIAGTVIHALLRRMLSPKTATGEEHRDYLYSLAVRRWHWGNALLFILLLLSGLFGHFSVGPVVLMVQVHTVRFRPVGLLGWFCANQRNQRQRLSLSGEV